MVLMEDSPEAYIGGRLTIGGFGLALLRHSFDSGSQVWGLQILAQSEIYDMVLGSRDREIIFTFGHDYSASPQLLVMMKYDTDSGTKS